MKKFPLSAFILTLFLVQMACNAPTSSEEPDTFATLNALYTVSAQTQTALGTPTPGLPQPTATPQQPLPTSTFSVVTPVPVSRCDAAAFIKDVTYPDGSVIEQDSSFTKTWRIQNTGTCTWNTSYALVFNGGTSMSSSSYVYLPQSVAPGGSVDVSVNLTAPAKSGEYRSYWKLRNASGVLFGVGSDANTPVWVDIEVSGPSFVSYDFAHELCDANWSNNEGSLPCPGTEDDPQGYAIKMENPKMEDGKKHDLPGILAVPQEKKNGFILGQYPSITINKGDRFLALIGCYQNAPDCNLKFSLEYKNNGQVIKIAEWQEVAEGQLYPVDVDLGSLAGETLKIILRVSANGQFSDDYAVWLNPRIISKGSGISPR